MVREEFPSDRPSLRPAVVCIPQTSNFPHLTHVISEASDFFLFGIINTEPRLYRSPTPAS